jgi:hypothetical protein
VTIDDAVFLAKLNAGLDAALIGNTCPPIGEPIQGGSIALTWGDFDCTQHFDLADAIAIVRYLIGLNGTIAECPLIAANFVFVP